MNTDVLFNEYGPKVPACIQPCKPGCPYVAVIPTVTVQDKSGIKNLSACFVHVANINTTFYIDDKHRIIVTYAGPIIAKDYDFDKNPLDARNQLVFDFVSNKGAVYNDEGDYRTFALSLGV